MDLDRLTNYAMSGLDDNDESMHAYAKSLNKGIKAIKLDNDDALTLTFTDDTWLKFLDGGQDCCEIRYMRTDDNLDDYVGGIFIGIEILDGPTVDDDHGDVHEVQFLHVKTSRGQFTMSNHNEHNGYYGGFNITASQG